MSRWYSSRAVAVALVVIAVACKGDPAAPGERPARVVITRAFPSLFEQDTTLLTATAFRADGSVLTGATVSWSSDAKAIATVAAHGTGGSEGIVTSIKPGNATITATANGVAGTSVVVVLSRAVRPNREISFLADTLPSAGVDLKRLRIVNPDGTGARTITPALQNVGSYTWSPNGDRVAVSYTASFGGGPLRGLYVLNADGSAPRQLDAVGGDNLRWSPDGNSIASWRGTAEGPHIFVNAVAGGPAVQLTSGNRQYVLPEWSPDSRQIVYSQALPTTQELWIAAADRSVPPRQILVPVPARDARWSPDGKYLTFGNGKSVWVVNADGSNPHPVAGSCTIDGQCIAGPVYWYPAWSRDGRTVMYSRSDYGPYYRAVERVTIDGKTMTPVRGEGCCNGEVLASPDGAWLLQGAIMPGNVQWPGAAVMHTDGSSWKFITPSENASAAQWRP